MALTKKEKKFCEEYIANGCNASRAYQSVYGCTIEDARKRYCKTFRKPEVKEYINALQKEAFEEACITAERIALKLSDIAFASKDDEVYGASAQLKALDLLQKQLSLQTQRVEAEVSTDINIIIE
ncbi:MAG: terminase small subunit [Ruminococcaceae bacterium]|nr:terminase small subunit [Oscillospiraceae bacterium]